MNPLLLLLIPIGVIVGAFSAGFGIGGGLMMVPVMVLGYGLDQHAAQGTSLAVIVPTAVVGVIAHNRRGLVSWDLAMWMALGGVAGVLLGARVALNTDATTLKWIFGAVVILAGCRLIAEGLRQGRHSDTE